MDAEQVGDDACLEAPVLVIITVQRVTSPQSVVGQQSAEHLSAVGR
ncbi:hypothetical protein [Nocardia flavorosea]|uniref:Uncharacterized protein n=1 Tax=Nocardia flavorosea TaxID=53429 RepID=A0A846YKN0_9NOCA|nr:hypothetical protein [Nocardia flavorosea]NKY59403.1 hypothetical protein [Nocardia flavorosea]